MLIIFTERNTPSIFSSQSSWMCLYNLFDIDVLHALYIELEGRVDSYPWTNISCFICAIGYINPGKIKFDNFIKVIQPNFCK